MHVAIEFAARDRFVDFLGLNQREQLHRERARRIGLFGGALEAESDGRASDADRTMIARMALPMLPHAGCVRAFKKIVGHGRR